MNEIKGSYLSNEQIELEEYEYTAGSIIVAPDGKSGTIDLLFHYREHITVSFKINTRRKLLGKKQVIEIDEYYLPGKVKSIVCKDINRELKGLPRKERKPFTKVEVKKVVVRNTKPLIHIIRKKE